MTATRPTFVAVMVVETRWREFLRFPCERCLKRYGEGVLLCAFCRAENMASQLDSVHLFFYKIIEWWQNGVLRVPACFQTTCTGVYICFFFFFLGTTCIRIGRGLWKVAAPPPPYDPDGSGRRVSPAVREAVTASRVVCLNFSHDVCELNLRFRCACCFRFFSITWFFCEGCGLLLGLFCRGVYL